MYPLANSADRLPPTQGRVHPVLFIAAAPDSPLTQLPAADDVTVTPPVRVTVTSSARVSEDRVSPGGGGAPQQPPPADHS